MRDHFGVLVGRPGSVLAVCLGLLLVVGFAGCGAPGDTAADGGGDDAGSTDGGGDAGSCDPACQTGAPHARSACVAGACAYYCDPGYVDADEDWTRVATPGPGSDGCELACTRLNGGVETCDGQDDDCNGVVDDVGPGSGAPVWYRDADGDGHGDPATARYACAGGPGWVGLGDDCDDHDPTVFQVYPWYADGDGDGYTTARPYALCAGDTPPPGAHVAPSAAPDCDDTDPAVHPGAQEICDGKDDDCDGVVDGPTPAGAPLWFVDADGDGHGSDASGPHLQACTAPAGYAQAGDDCDDTDPSVYYWYQLWPDADGDGYTTGAVYAVCAGDVPPPGGLTMPTQDSDCDDTDPTVHPFATEICDGKDDDCDGVIDPPTSVGAQTWYLDCDADGYALVTASGQTGCAMPPQPGTAACGILAGTWTTRAPVDAASADCADDNALVHPGQTSFFTVGVVNGQVPPGGSYDYDCDGALTLQYGATGRASCDAQCGGSGWTGATLPACGQSASFLACAPLCPSCGNTCGATIVTQTQGCR